MSIYIRMQSILNEIYKNAYIQKRREQLCSLETCKFSDIAMNCHVPHQAGASLVTFRVPYIKYKDRPCYVSFFLKPALVGHVLWFSYPFVFHCSILVNSLDWARLRPNLPWLVDAGGCVLLDSFIILQFLYFHYRKQSGRDELDNLDKA